MLSKTKKTITWTIGTILGLGAILAGLISWNDGLAQEEEITALETEFANFYDTYEQDYDDIQTTIMLMNDTLGMVSNGLDKLVTIHTNGDIDEQILILGEIETSIQRLRITANQRDLAPLEIENLADLLGQRLEVEQNIISMRGE